MTRDYVLARDKKRLRRMLGLPKRLIEDVHLDMGPAQEQVYQQIAAGKLDELQGLDEVTRPHVLAMLGQLKQAAVSPELVDVPGESAKMEWLSDKLDGLDEPVVAFSQYRDTAPLVARVASRHGYELFEINGSMSPAERQAEIARWRNGPDKRLFMISLRAGGFGINLQDSRVVVHIDRWWNPAVEDQASDRTWRLGQKRDVTVYTLGCRGTIDMHIARMQADKRLLAEVIERQDEDTIRRMALGGDITAHIDHVAHGASVAKASAPALSPIEQSTSGIEPPAPSARDIGF
jgi:SNF2 family DNA or RNA helicase